MSRSEEAKNRDALPGERPPQDAAVRVRNPRNRVPLSFIIDDSTCLVNLAYFGIPAFSEAFPDRYKQDWRSLPREIPDSFVREFGEWCHEHSVKGKYSIVPYPACVGWIDREMPGWTRKELEDSLELVRTLMTPDWDIHPEMISHTWVIDTKTGRPYPERTPRFMENWDWTAGRSTDELADYMSYALRLLHNVGLPCEGITTPGGFAHQVLPELSQATLEACRSIYKAEIPHYFRHLFTDDRSVAPRVEYASGLDGNDPRCVVSIIGCTGDWFGGWDGLTPGSVDLLITEDLQGGRLPEVIAREEPAILVCHWPGIYYNGEKIGFRIFQEAVRRVHARYDNLLWMKLSEIARYWAAKELTRIERKDGAIRLNAPYAAPDFTLETPGEAASLTLTAHGQTQRLREVKTPLELVSGTWCRQNGNTLACFDLPKGESVLQREG
ncbi:MAG TPA: hypothetical protein VFB21_23755 [Chthonomonadaceae bacterium]|nr:hypothetical protein [Chthonomonadaceae bacterium]